MDSLAALFREVGAPLSIECITLDPPGPTEVLVRNVAVGLCRTDFHVMRGERRVAMRPMVLGHEAAGIVEETGAAVTAIKPHLHPRLRNVPLVPPGFASPVCRRAAHHPGTAARRHLPAARPRRRRRRGPSAWSAPLPSGRWSTKLRSW